MNGIFLTLILKESLNKLILCSGATCLKTTEQPDNKEKTPETESLVELSIRIRITQVKRFVAVDTINKNLKVSFGPHILSKYDMLNKMLESCNKIPGTKLLSTNDAIVKVQKYFKAVFGTSSKIGTVRSLYGTACDLEFTKFLFTRNVNIETTILKARTDCVNEGMLLNLFIMADILSFCLAAI